LNNVVGPYFKSAKGVRQGYPFSRTLFNMVVECLIKIVLKDQKNNLSTGFALDLIDKRVVVLQYADDTSFCINRDFEQVVNLKLLLHILR
jgi:hypothetical protein